jgi:hypothetical protein
MLLITSWSPWGNDLVGVDGILDFDALHSGKHNGEIQFCAFNVSAWMETIYARAATISPFVASAYQDC